MNKKQIAILGSTGSIGTQALEVIAAHPDKFEVYAITANNSVELLIEQAVRFQPEMVIIANEQHYAYIKKALENYPIKVYAGVKAICEMVELPSVDVVLTAMVGYAGLLPTIHAVKAGKRIALANKETLVVAGEIICDLAQQYRSAIIPSQFGALSHFSMFDWRTKCFCRKNNTDRFGWSFSPKNVR